MGSFSTVIVGFYDKWSRRPLKNPLGKNFDRAGTPLMRIGGPSMGTQPRDRALLCGMVPTPGEQ